jgi:hypothetical protein
MTTETTTTGAVDSATHLLDELRNEFRSLVASHQAEISELRTELDELRSDDTEQSSAAQRPVLTSRRRLFALAGGAAAVAAVGVATTGARPAAALNGNPIGIGTGAAASSGAASPTVLDYSPTTGSTTSYLIVSDSFAPLVGGIQVSSLVNNAAICGEARKAAGVATGVTGYAQVPNGNGIVGLSVVGQSGFGVWGLSTDGGYGVYAQSATGYDVYLGGSGRIGMDAHVAVGPPLSGHYNRGDIVADKDGNLFVNVTGGTPGTFRKLAGPSTAGAFHPIAPVRVYDSRSALPSKGLLAAATNRTVSVADGRDLASGAVNQAGVVPAGAVAVTCNVTVVNTEGPGGFVVVNPGGNTTINASSVNWFAANQIISNGITATLNGNRELTILTGPGGSGGTDFIIDITGYYL